MVAMLPLAGAACAAIVSAPIVTHDPKRQGSRVEAHGFVGIGGIPQWLTTSGANRHNPVALFLHGGPGNPLSPYSQSLYGEWTQDFSIVQWDQRGAGRNFARNPGTADTQLTMELMAGEGPSREHFLFPRRPR